jgi:diguanylate cyclase (GGDEF)-like protein
MDRSDAVRLLRVLVALLLGSLPLAGIGLLSVLPPIQLTDGKLDWLPLAVSAALVAAASLTALAALIDGLRHRRLPSLLQAGASAALAGGAIGLVAGAASISVALVGASLLVAASVVAARTAPLGDDRTARLVAIVVMLGAEAAAVAGLLPATAEAIAGLDGALLGAAAAIAAVSMIGAPARHGPGAVLMAAGAVGLLADRSGSLEAVVGLAALVAGQLVALLTIADAPLPDPAEHPEEELPELAARLADGVLRFDGRLQLREWNRAAADLLGLDRGSVGARVEDLLGVSLAELPGEDHSVLAHGAVGGLEVALHRSGSGVVAVVRDPGARPESERLGQELRSTIEELLRARRTIDLQRGELERSSTVDALTGISSRGAIMERLRTEVAEARRYRHPLAIVLVDVDRFGEINQLHGVSGGDAVLREVALRFRLRVREADALGRLGSDGFVAVLPHTDEGGAATFADALRHRLSQRPISIGDVQARVTISVGVTTMQPGEDLDVDALLARGQEALDSARGAGGDRIALDRLHGLARLEDPQADAAPREEDERPA